MASVGNSIRKAIEDWEIGDLEFAMLHACNAVDGTARKVWPNWKSRARFVQLIRDGYSIFGPMAVPGINVRDTRWPVVVQRPSAEGGHPDLADVIYGIHRCVHMHGDELPDGFDLVPVAAQSQEFTEVRIERGKLRLPDRVIFGLLALAVANPVNTDQRVPDGYFLSHGSARMPINEWWGRREDMERLVSQVPMPNVKMDFGDWMPQKSHK